MTQMPWFRVYSEILDDRKIRRICKKTGHSKALVIGVWVCLLALASESPKRGVLNISEDMPYTLADIEDELEIPNEILGQLIEEFRAMGMIGGKTTIEIVNWQKRQFRSDNSYERVKRFRNVSCNALRNVKETETESDTESETDPASLAAPVSQEPAPQDFISQVSQITGLYPTANDMPVIIAWENKGTIPADIRDALQWRKDNAKPPIKTIAHLDGGVEVARLKRIQGQNAKPGLDRGGSLLEQGYTYVGHSAPTV